MTTRERMERLIEDLRDRAGAARDAAMSQNIRADTFTEAARLMEDELAKVFPPEGENLK